MSLTFVLEALVVLGCIIMGTRFSGIAVGLWGGLGVAVLVFVFGEAPGAPPSGAVAIILAVVTAAAMMQAAGGIDWMVQVAAHIIERHPRQITLIAPLTAFLFSIGAGTSNILYPLLPVVFDVSYRNGIRPSRPMSVTVVQSGVALSASPVSAAMAAMLTLTDVPPYHFGLTQILAITLPACVIGIIVTSIVVSHLGPELEDDPQVQEKIRAGLLPPLAVPAAQAPVAVGAPAPVLAGGGSGASGAVAVAPGAVGSAGDGEGVPGDDLVGTEGGSQGTVPGSAGTESFEAVSPVPASAALTSTKEGRNAALVFLLGVVVIVLLGLFPHLRPTYASGDETVRLDMTSTIVLVMFVAAVVILLVSRPDVKKVPEMSVFRAGMVSAIALFGIAWLTATFIDAHETYIVDTVGGWIDSWQFMFAAAVFVVAALTTSQSTATRTMVPIGLAAGLAPGLLTGMWAGALGAVYSLPTGGPQIAGANFDLSGTTKLGTKLVDHSYFVPMLILSVTTILVGSIIGVVFF